METTRLQSRSLLSLLVGVFTLHALALFYQTYSEEIVHSFSQSSAGIKVFFEHVPKTYISKKIITRPVVSREKAAAPAQESVSMQSEVASVQANATSTQDIKLIYLGELRELIESKKVYPLQAKRLGQTGTVEVTFTLRADGHVMNARVTQESPYDRLNQAALATVNEVRHFRPIPPEIGQDSMTVKIPMRYSLYQ